MPMATTITISVVAVLLLLQPALSSSSPYLSPSLFQRDYDHMLCNLKIYAYAPLHNNTFPSSSPAALFHRALLRSSFLTTDPTAAHLFYLTSPLDHARHLARTVRTIRSDLPFWNRALGADHFFLTEAALDPGSDRNLLELTKNSIQISPYNVSFPHKDLTLPRPLPHRRSSLPSYSFKYLAFYNGNETPPIAAVLGGLRGVLVETGRRLDAAEREEGMRRSRFCLFFEGSPEGVGSIGEALSAGCVPVVVAERAPVALPFGDVLRWGDMAVVVGMGGGAEAVRRAIEAVEGERYRRMREMGVRAGGHFRWTAEDEEGEHDNVDVFRTILYQLWRRRHVIRYSAWEVTAR